MYCFVVLTYNSSSILEECLISIQENFLSRDYEITVIDNDSSDIHEISEICRRYKCTLIERSSNDGYAKGNNEIIGKSNADFLVFMNPDSRIRKWGTKTLKKIEQSKSYIWGPRLYDTNGKLELPFYFDWEHQTPFNQLFSLKVRNLFGLFKKEKMWINGPFFIIKRHCFELVGGMSETTFLYNEEYVLKKRLLEHFGDYEAEYLKDLHVVHLKKDKPVNYASLKLSVDSALAVCQELSFPKKKYIDMRIRQLVWRRFFYAFRPEIADEISKTLEYLHGKS